MRLAKITSSNPELVREQLAHTDAYLVDLYSLGNSTVLYTEAKQHADIIIQNKKRQLSKSEVEFAIRKLLKVEPSSPYLEIIQCGYFTEVTLDKSLQLAAQA